MSRQPTPSAVTTIGIDIGKNTFHLIGLDRRGLAIEDFARAELERPLANVSRCLIGMEACSGARHIGRQLVAL
jgi:transposase